MHILLTEIEIQIPASQSLKDKRSSVKSIIEKLRQTVNVSVAEVDHHDKWQLAGLAVVTVSNLHSRVQKTQQSVLDMIEERFDVVIVGVQETWL